MNQRFRVGDTVRINGYAEYSAVPFTIKEILNENDYEVCEYCNGVCALYTLSSKWLGVIPYDFFDCELVAD